MDTGMETLSKEDQDLLARCLSKLNTSDISHCLLLPSGEFQRATGLNDRQSAHARTLIFQILYPWRANLQRALPHPQQQQQHPPGITTGDPRLDLCLGGFLPPGSLTEIVGESATGKTQLCLQLTVSALLYNPSSEVIYIYTEGAFPAGRLAGMARRRTNDVDALMRRVHVAEFADLETMLHAMEYKVPGILAKGVVPLVVVDSVAAHLRFGDDPDQMAFYRRRAAMMVQLGKRIKKWNGQWRCAVLATNQVRDVFGEPPAGAYRAQVVSLVADRKAPALGAVWANIIDARIVMYQRRAADAGAAEIAENIGRNRRWIELEFSPWAPRAQCEVTLSDSGFHHI
ncbi:P-loop containing nucleoside triphosphate hydrolase protein [Kickxella alabastrina]|uniref:P-loop containing nucleoside triphosphate hydrolase protein n=1 Tax=Kickxella alabastrina TaxID=61397 RepID=UPI00221F0ABC|nr:P-loop containing nucleoside triphosphate hydrolase protein [Kickxella alabastrina]KAI7835118.1 P-loop containing nucleoside triphosphate hydrolase protein [Kickxella alabastrina]KAJ1947519.1 DNA repair protein rhp57 [Kickxella alabastrina]